MEVKSGFRTVSIVIGLGFILATASHAQDPCGAAQGVLTRLLPGHAEEFRWERIPAEDGQEVFEIESSAGHIVIRGSSAVAMTSGLNWYLKHYANACMSLSGDQLTLPSPLPVLPEKVRIVTPFPRRYCFNYCCFSYSMAWWDWAQWERIIDWMALHGINMPLSVTGQEAIWQSVYHRLGLSDEDLSHFFVGPAYLPFGWMGCMDGWGGPLTQAWIDRHLALQKQIVARERELGMTPVLQGFTGHVPEALKKKFPDARYLQLPSWCGFPGTSFLDPQDPLFQTIGKAFIEEQTRQFGTDHLYGSDTFIEMSPPSNDPGFLDAMAKAVHGAMTAGDPEAIWVMQGWLFFNNPSFWQPAQTKALLEATARDRMIVLDLYCEKNPVWEITESFHGNPWVWCIIQNFGNQVSLHGGLPQIMENLTRAVSSPQRGKLCGAGFIMEGLGNNPVVYDLMSDLMWKPEQTDLNKWIEGYAQRRYGRPLDAAARAWKGLLSTAYRTPGQTGSVVCARPSLKGESAWTGSGRPYDPIELGRSFEELLSCAETLQGVDPYGFDIVHVLRQILGNQASPMQLELLSAYRAGDQQRLAAAGDRFLALILDMDELLASRKEFLLGRWLSDAGRWAQSKEEQRHYEWNARNQITLWGPPDSGLHDYANKQWAGLLRSFYYPRWEQFIGGLKESLDNQRPFDSEAFEKQMQTWEASWTHGEETFADDPQGDSVSIARRLWEKYRGAVMEPEALSLTTGKTATCSSSLPDYPADLANDGRRYDTDRYWATDVNVDRDCWWQVDLGGPVAVGRIVPVFYFGDDRRYEFMVQTSLDGTAWDMAADYRGLPQRATAEGVSCAISGRPVRYIRVTVTANSANTGRHLVEVMAYGDAGDKGR